MVASTWFRPAPWSEITLISQHHNAEFNPGVLPLALFQLNRNQKKCHATRMSLWDSQAHFPTLLQHATSEWSMRICDPAAKHFLGRQLNDRYHFTKIPSRSHSACQSSLRIPRSIFVMRISGNCSLREEIGSFQMTRVNT